VIVKGFAAGLLPLAAENRLKPGRGRSKELAGPTSMRLELASQKQMVEVEQRAESPHEPSKPSLE